MQFAAQEVLTGDVAMHRKVRDHALDGAILLHYG
jgi:hypothetical protein